VKPLFILIALILLSGCAGVRDAMFTPSPVENYCKRIIGNDRRDSEAFMTCIKQELDAREKLSNITVPSHIAMYCRELSEATGGSYQVMMTCVKKEMTDL
jgi:hypothetical protein